MQATDYSEYLRKAYENKLAAINEQAKANEYQRNFDSQTALANHIETNRTAANQYAQQMNKYGVNAERLAQGGLNNSGYAQRVNTGNYVNYQNTLGNSTRNYLSALGNVQNQAMQNQYNTEASRLNALTDYNNNLYAEYKRLSDLEYQLERDRISDAQWNKTYDLKRLLAGG